MKAPSYILAIASLSGSETFGADSLPDDIMVAEAQATTLETVIV